MDDDDKGKGILAGVLAVWLGSGLAAKGLQAIANRYTVGNRGRTPIYGDDAVLFGYIMVGFGGLAVLIGLVIFYAIFASRRRW